LHRAQHAGARARSRGCRSRRVSSADRTDARPSEKAMTRAGSTSDEGILCCDVGTERFAFRSSDVRHVERSEYLRVDRGEDGRLGLLKLGGQHVPVYALDEVFARTPLNHGTNTGDGHIAVTGNRNALTG